MSNDVTSDDGGVSLDAPEKMCGLFSDRRTEFCTSCTIEPDSGFVDGETFNILAGKCMRVLDASLLDLENAPLTPQQIDALATEIILKIDRIINNRYKLEDINRQAAEIILKRFDTLQKRFGAKRSKLCVEIGNLYFGLRDYKSAIDWYDLASKINPENKDAWNNKGVALVRLGNPEKSLHFYDLAIKIDPSYEQAWFNKGKALFKLRRITEAIGCFDRTTQINPDSITAWNNKGVLLRILGKNKEAIACYENSIRLRPDYEWAWHNKGMALADMGKNADALDCFEKALSINPNFKPSIDARESLGKRRGFAGLLFGRRGHNYKGHNDNTAKLTARRESEKRNRRGKNIPDNTDNPENATPDENAE